MIADLEVSLSFSNWCIADRQKDLAAKHVTALEEAQVSCQLRPVMRQAHV